MKNTALLIFSFFCFFIFFSCGDENFEPYPNQGFDIYKGLLPSEYIQTTTDRNTGAKITTTTTLHFDNLNRLIYVESSISDSIISTQSITYNESNGNVNTYSIENAKGTQLYTYEYKKSNIILEHRTFKTIHPPNYPEIEPYTRTLSVSGGKLIKSEDPREIKTNIFKYDKKGNLIESNKEHYDYNNLTGIMSNTKTPKWLFVALEGNLPFSNNLVNNCIIGKNRATYKYEYDKDLHPKYPKKVIINNNEVITIKYILAK
ncbi:MAG: hypothetical protein M3Z80_08990 [Apibacter sp.]|uniref:hypothetical protein n=1 Tax=Apibacter sp. TaxID=2023709 RepID=UPI0025D32F98|nr:hypothetical protein [Apibacter sp.]MCT6870067.1 hypothetical protein [Apibacter sp.]